MQGGLILLDPIFDEFEQIPVKQRVQIRAVPDYRMLKQAVKFHEQIQNTVEKIAEIQYGVPGFVVDQLQPMVVPACNFDQIRANIIH